MKLTAFVLAAAAIVPSIARVVNTYDRNTFQAQRISHDVFRNVPNYANQRLDTAPPVWSNHHAEDVAAVSSAAEDIVSTFSEIVKTIYSIKLKLIDITAWTAIVVIPQIVGTITYSLTAAFVNLSKFVFTLTKQFTEAESDLIIGAFTTLVNAFVELLQLFAIKRSLLSGFILAPLVKTIYLALLTLHNAVFLVLNAVLKLLAVGVQAKAQGLIDALSGQFTIVIRIYAA